MYSKRMYVCTVTVAVICRKYL